jgi:hypothetical protein
LRSLTTWANSQTVKLPVQRSRECDGRHAQGSERAVVKGLSVLSADACRSGVMFSNTKD